MVDRDYASKEEQAATFRNLRTKPGNSVRFSLRKFRLRVFSSALFSKMTPPPQPFRLALTAIPEVRRGHL